MVNRYFSAVIIIVMLLMCGYSIAKEFYSYPATDTIQGRDISLIRRPSAAGYDNVTGTRTITGATLRAIFQTRSAATRKVDINDTRLGDARTPLAHNQAVTTIVGLAAIAITNQYSSLSGKPTIPAPQVKSDWTANGTLAEILHKPAETCTGRISYDGLDGANGTNGTDGTNGTNGVAGPANTLSVGTISTVAYTAPSTCTITGTAPTQVLSCAFTQGIPGEAATLTRASVIAKLAEPSDTQLTLQAGAVSSGGVLGGLIIRDYLGNVALAISPGNIKTFNSSGVMTTWIETSTGVIAVYDSAGRLATRMDPYRFMGVKTDGISMGFNWDRATSSLTLY